MQMQFADDRFKETGLPPYCRDIFEYLSERWVAMPIPVRALILLLGGGEPAESKVLADSDFVILVRGNRVNQVMAGAHALGAHCSHFVHASKSWGV